MRGSRVLLGILMLSQIARAQQIVMDANTVIVRMGDAVAAKIC
jgi:hypothetical protein